MAKSAASSEKQKSAKPKTKPDKPTKVEKPAKTEKPAKPETEPADDKKSLDRGLCSKVLTRLKYQANVKGDEGARAAINLYSAIPLAKKQKFLMDCEKNKGKGFEWSYEYQEDQEAEQIHESGFEEDFYPRTL